MTFEAQYGEGPQRVKLTSVFEKGRMPSIAKFKFLIKGCMVIWRSAICDKMGRSVDSKGNGNLAVPKFESLFFIDFECPAFERYIWMSGFHGVEVIILHRNFQVLHIRQLALNFGLLQ